MLGVRDFGLFKHTILMLADKVIREVLLEREFGLSFTRHYVLGHASKRATQSLKCGHSPRMVSNPIFKAASVPSSGFSYPSTKASTRLEGAVTGESSISSGVANGRRISRNGCISCGLPMQS